MQRLFVVNRNLITRLNISQSKKQDVTVERPHVRVRLARMIDVVSSVATPRPIKTPASIDVTDTEDTSVASTLLGFEI